MDQLSQFKNVCNSVGPSVKNLTLNFFGQKLNLLPECHIYRAAMNQFSSVRSLSISVHAGNGYKLLMKELLRTVQNVSIYRTLEHIEIHDIYDTFDPSLEIVAKFLGNCPRLTSVKYFSL